MENENQLLRDLRKTTEAKEREKSETMKRRHAAEEKRKAAEDKARLRRTARMEEEIEDKVWFSWVLVKL